MNASADSAHQRHGIDDAATKVNEEDDEDAAAAAAFFGTADMTIA